MGPLLSRAESGATPDGPVSVIPLLSHRGAPQRGASLRRVEVGEPQLPRGAGGERSEAVAPVPVSHADDVSGGQGQKVRGEQCSDKAERLRGRASLDQPPSRDETEPRADGCQPHHRTDVSLVGSRAQKSMEVLHDAVPDPKRHHDECDPRDPWVARELASTSHHRHEEGPLNEQPGQVPSHG